jgi:hypothetical protein
MTKGDDGVVLVVGALGVVGRAALDLFTRTPGWSVIGRLCCTDRLVDVLSPPQAFA